MRSPPPGFHLFRHPPPQTDPYRHHTTPPSRLKYPALFQALPYRSIKFFEIYIPPVPFPLHPSSIPSACFSLLPAAPVLILPMPPFPPAPALSLLRRHSPAGTRLLPPR